MASNIILKKSSVVSKVPVAGDLQFGELALNYADGKLYYKKSDGTTIDAFSSAASSGVSSVSGTAPIISSGGTAPAISISAATTSAAGSMSAADKTKLDGIAAGATANTGTVTSVGGTGTVSGLSLSGTVTTSGNLTLGGTLSVTPSNFASQTANTILAAPNGAAGVPTFRAIVAADVPTLNQNTTGTASNVTGTVAIANGGTGATTASAARTNLGATTLGGNIFTLANVAAISFPRFNADNTVSSLDAAAFRTAIGAGTSSTTGTVTSVGGTGTVSGLTLSGTVTTSGNLTLGGTLAVTPSNFASQTANTILAAPNGSAGVPTFRAIVAADIPTLNQNTTGTAANVTGTVAIANGGTGATTRQNAMDALAGSVTSGQYLRGNGTDVVMSAIQAADVPTLNQNTTGTAAVSTAATVTTSSTASAFKVPFANTTANTTGNYGLLQDSEGTFTYNPSTNTLTVGQLTTANDIICGQDVVLPNDRYLYWGTGDGSANIRGSSASDYISFSTLGNERGRFDASGNFYVGTNDGGYNYAGNSMRYMGSILAGLMLSCPTTSAANQISFWNPNGQVGQINSQNSGTIYGTSSDYRLKHDIQPMSGALAKVQQLKPVTYKWNVDGSDGQGFIAHELQEVVPDCVVGAKDAVGDDGNPRYQSIDTSFLVATLTAAIQEQQAIIQDLKARIEALEAPKI